jgi:hypothetical protein
LAFTGISGRCPVSEDKYTSWAYWWWQSQNVIGILSGFMDCHSLSDFLEILLKPLLFHNEFLLSLNCYSRFATKKLDSDTNELVLVFILVEAIK